MLVNIILWLSALSLSSGIFVCSQTMPYSQFKTIGDAIDAFDLTLEEGKFFPEVAPIAPSNTLSDYLADTLPAVADGQRKSTLRRHYLPRPACTNIP